MSIKCRVIGGAGTGKTTYLVSRIKDGLDSYVRSDRIGLISFTKAAALEVVGRLRDSDFTYEDDDWGCPAHMDFPWVRTIHSCVFQLLSLKRGDLLVGEDVAKELIEDGMIEPDDRRLFELAVVVWGMRGTLKGRGHLERTAVFMDEKLVADKLWDYVRMYEQWKRLEGKIDFTDMLAIYAGIKFHIDGEFDVVEPDGEVPQIDLWLFDEQQDVSPLLGMVCDRFVAGGGCIMAYYAGDPFQSIYGWAGSGSKSFMGFKADEEVVLRKSYRVPSAILRVGEGILKRCSDYWDRGIEAESAGGEVEWWSDFDCNAIGGGSDVFVLSRTNARAEEIGRALTWAGVPWLPVGSGRGWFQIAEKYLNSPWRITNKVRATRCLWRLSKGLPVCGSDLRRVVEQVPSVWNGERLVEHGGKAWYDKLSDGQLDDMGSGVVVSDLRAWHFTDYFIRLVRNWGWVDLIDGAKRWCGAADHLGEEVVLNPRVRVGTIHSAKGMEAEWVVLDTSITKRIYNQIDAAFAVGDNEYFDEECRVWYVGATRARKRLTLLQDKGWYRAPFFDSDGSFVC